jgi:hypothetical protein
MSTPKKGFLGFESKHHPVLPTHVFAKRMTGSGAIAVGLIGLSLFGGMCGYHLLEELPWIDSFLNASMILGGMGPVDAMRTDSGKLFAGCYALYSGLMVVVVAGIIWAPVMHRILHQFHATPPEKKE